jgi:hypothetical protein
MRFLYFIGLIVVFTGCKSVETSIIVKAKPKDVWKTLLETDRYHEWNPVMELLEGELIEGNKVKYNVTETESKQTQIGAKVKKVIKNKELNQTGGIPLVLRFNHKFLLKPEGIETKITITEKYSGFYVLFWSSKDIKKAYERLNLAIKQRTESLKVK